MKTLIVDDHATVREFLVGVLATLGFEPTAVPDAGSALEAYSGDYPLVILDWVLPDLDGLELCRKIRDLPDGDLPVILLLTGRDRPEDLQSVLEAGADDYLKKPVNVDYLEIRLTIAARRAQQRAARREVEKKLLRLEKAVETMQIGVTISDPDQRILYSNPADARMHGYRQNELEGQDVRIFAPRKVWNQPMSLERLAGLQTWKRESINVRKDGSTFPVQITSDVVTDASGRPLGIVTSCEDITDRKRAEEALRSSEERYALAARGANDGLWDWDLESGEVYLSKRWKSMIGFDEEDIDGRVEEWFDRVHPGDRERFNKALEDHLKGDSSHFECSHRMLRKGGDYCWVLSRGLAVRDADGKPSRMAGSLTDLTDRGVHDMLTGLPNLTLFLYRVQNALDRQRRRGEYLYAVLMLGLDRFKIINDSLGHVVANELLVAVARRLEAGLRASDVLSRLEATVARVGGDEFIVLLEDIDDLGDAIRAAERLQEIFELPFDFDGQEVFTTASLGIALSTASYERPEDLVRDADTALQRAKALGKASFEVFDPAMHARAVSTLRIESELRHALERDELRVFYQPIVSLYSGQITGLEALVRWQHPTEGLLPPGRFLSIAEESELIVLIDRWILHEACRQMADWQREQGSELGFSLTVNISSRQFSRPDFVDEVRTTLEKTGFPNRRLKLEITESLIMKDPDFAAQVLAQLRELGLEICVDDFGTGYSSLSRLQTFPLNMLKIDRSFIVAMDEVESGTAIVKAIVDLAQNLRLDVVAEGIETARQLWDLTRMGCVYGQGYYFSKPLPPEELRDSLVGRPLWNPQTGLPLTTASG